MAPVYWLMSDDALKQRTARELRGAVLARGRSSSAERALPLTVDKGVATIHVAGVLTPTPDADAAWTGEANTLYPELQTALHTAVADKKVREIVWSIDSPGGAVDGLFALLDDIADARAAGAKPMSVRAENAHSAAYGIAAAVGRITAMSRMSSFGSVGVATQAFVLGDMIGKVHHLTNSESPEKRPEISTPEGRAVVTRYLDQIAGEFMGAIAQGRGVPIGEVASSYGRGASMLASAALSAKLIDAIAPRPSASVPRDLTDASRAGTPSPMADASIIEPSPEAPASPVAETPSASDDSAIPVDVDMSALAAEERAELEALRADRDAREVAERRSLVTALVEIGSETPATAWSGTALAARLASEPLADLRTRVAALRAARPEVIKPPPSGATDTDGLSEAEAAHAEKISDPVARGRFVKLCRDMRAKQGK